MKYTLTEMLESKIKVYYYNMSYLFVFALCFCLFVLCSAYKTDKQFRAIMTVVNKEQEIVHDDIVGKPIYLLCQADRLEPLEKDYAELNILLSKPAPKED